MPDGISTTEKRCGEAAPTNDSAGHPGGARKEKEKEMGTKKKRNWMAAHLVKVLIAIIAVVGASALIGCDSNPPESACLDSGNPFCSNYVPPSGTGGSGANNGSGGTGNTAGTGGNTTPPANCGALPSFNCFGECVVLTTDEANCGSCGRACGGGQSCVNGFCTWNTPPDQCTPSAEVCDSTDNDCDLAIDEEFNLFTDDANCGTCGRACANGQSCVNSHCQWDNVQDECVSTGAEVCNYIDDDCDGALDEGFNLLADSTNCGTCGHVCSTDQHCDNGHCAWNNEQNFCTPTSSGEICDNIDNDCNNSIDEGYNLLADNANCGTCGHSCAADQHCDNGHCSWDTAPDNCTPTAATELCDNVDNDCNGEIDEIFNLQNDNTNCGTCGRACDTGALCLNSVCYFATPVDNCTPSDELCNSRDDNCNGWVDEGYNLLTDSLNCGMCGRDCGTDAVCDNGHCQLITPVLTCTPSQEVCNYTDDDCDGEVDELINLQSDEANCGVCGLACATDQVCDTGHCQWIVPPLNCTPVQETCNGLDDDCDSVIDDGFSLLNDPLNCGACGRVCGANQHCENGACALDVPDDQCVPSAEVCDSVDNNCNGTIDEGINMSTDNANCGVCGRVCPAGQVCQSGACSWIVPPTNCTPSQEVCDSVDNDCDGAIDDGFVLTNDVNNCGTCGHVCAANQVCDNGHCAWITPPTNCTPAPETCDNSDEDCDGVIDDGFNLSNDELNCGECGVICGANQYCLNGHCANQVPANVCTPTDEVCDNVDNNCNSQIDEGITLATDPANCGTCGNACAAGQSCQAGHCMWNTPQNGCAPAPELCDNVDNDCDNVVDEGYNLQTDSNNCGQCGRVCGANQHCELGTCAWNTPVNQCVPAPETCDSVDNDCDNSIDEGFVLSNDELNCGTCGHACAANQFCQNGYCSWITPVTNCGPPTVEVCDNADNDCDGIIDEGFVLSSDEANCGTCGHVCGANQHCANGACVWDTPQNGCTTSAEVCDNVDNDCDGAIDETTNLNTDNNNCGYCGHACALDQHCTNGACAWDVPVNYCGPASEVCDGVDNDCDDLIDEDFLLNSDPTNCGSCGHVCAAGQYCENGYCAWIVPISNCGPPAIEVCDNADNDCDGLIDEGFNLSSDEDNCGTCGHTCAANQHCFNGACAWDVPLSVCTPVAETCDYSDNDCDGVIDDGFNLSSNLANCGACGIFCAANQHCVGGHCSWNVPQSSCVAVLETCNNVDDDCDLVIDEGFALTSDRLNCGTCGRTCAANQVCQSGKCEWIVPQSNCTPTLETCDYVDNDCDGVIDDGFNLATNNANCGQCGRACAAAQTCVNGHCAWNVPQTVCTPSAELCDQIDNDCDGLIDENWNLLTDKNHCGNCATVCPGTQFCQNGQCRLP